MDSFIVGFVSGIAICYFVLWARRKAKEFKSLKEEFYNMLNKKQKQFLNEKRLEITWG